MIDHDAAKVVQYKFCSSRAFGSSRRIDQLLSFQKFATFDASASLGMRWELGMERIWKMIEGPHPSLNLVIQEF